MCSVFKCSFCNYNTYEQVYFPVTLVKNGEIEDLKKGK